MSVPEHSTERGRRLALVLVTALLVLGTIPDAALAETRAGGSVVVESDEVVEEDLQVFGGSVTIEGRVEGDVRAIGGNVRISGTVTGDVSASSGSVVIASDGLVEGDLEAAAGTVFIAGTVDGSVRAAAGTISLTPSATIGGDLAYGGELTRADGATIAGSVMAEPALGIGSVVGVSIPGWVPAAYLFAVGLLATLILVAVFPAFSGQVARRAATDPLRSGGAGLLALIGVPFALALIAITLVGVPLALLGLVGYLIALWIGGLYGRYAVGQYVLGTGDYENRWADVLVGFLVVAVIVRVPLVGDLLHVIVLLVGFGAFAEGLYSRYRGDSGEEVPETTADAASA